MPDNLWPDLVPAVKEDPVPLWMMSFCDLVSLVLASFVLLFSMRELDTDDWNKMRGSMNGTFPSIIDNGMGSPPQKLSEETMLVGRKGSVLPYLMQVWKQKMASQPVWAQSEVVYAPESGELWMAWPLGADSQPAIDILQKWRNRVRLVANNPQDVLVALGYLQNLTQAGVLVAKEVRLAPGVGAGIWLVVEDKQ